MDSSSLGHLSHHLVPNAARRSPLTQRQWLAQHKPRHLPCAPEDLWSSRLTRDFFSDCNQHLALSIETQSRIAGPAPQTSGGGSSTWSFGPKQWTWGSTRLGGSSAPAKTWATFCSTLGTSCSTPASPLRGETRPLEWCDPEPGWAAYLVSDCPPRRAELDARPRREGLVMVPPSHESSTWHP